MKKKKHVLISWNFTYCCKMHFAFSSCCTRNTRNTYVSDPELVSFVMILSTVHFRMWHENFHKLINLCYTKYINLWSFVGQKCKKIVPWVPKLRNRNRILRTWDLTFDFFHQENENKCNFNPTIINYKILVNFGIFFWIFQFWKSPKWKNSRVLE